MQLIVMLLLLSLSTNALKFSPFRRRLHSFRPATTQFSDHRSEQAPAWPHSHPSKLHRVVADPYVSTVGATQYLITEHKFECPLFYDDDKADSTINVHCTVVDKLKSGTSGKSILEFLRHEEVGSLSLVKDYMKLMEQKSSRRSLLFLQGGPGFGSPRPGSSLSLVSSWASAAFSRGIDRIVLMDQRGTGGSEVITRQTLEMKFPKLFVGRGEEGYEEELANAVDFLSAFRAPSIVNDSEVIKKALLNGEQWDVCLGQSFGGFTLGTLLTTLPKSEHPKRSIFTGGLAPIHDSVDLTYKALWTRIRNCNDHYYRTFVGDVKRVKRIVKFLLNNPQDLPSGGILTPRRFLQLGISLGGGTGSHEQLHEIVMQAFLDDFVDDCDLVIDHNFLRKVDQLQTFGSNPLYFLLHESIYMNCMGEKSAFAAERVMPHDFRSFDDQTSIDELERCNFFGETMFSWMSEDYAELSGEGMTDLANRIAEKNDWVDSQLYNEENGLSFESASAAVYVDDMYVDMNLSLRTVKKGAALEGVQCLCTNELQHSGLRIDGENLFNKLYDMCLV